MLLPNSYVMLITWNRYSCWDIHMPTFFMTYSRQEEEVALLAEFLFFSRLNCFPNRRERKRRWAYSTIYICICIHWSAQMHDGEPTYIYIVFIYLREWVGGWRFRSNYYKCPIAHDGLHALLLDHQWWWDCEITKVDHSENIYLHRYHQEKFRYLGFSDMS